MKHIEKILLVISTVLFGLTIATWFDVKREYTRVDVKDDEAVVIVYDTDTLDEANKVIFYHYIDYVDYNDESIVMKYTEEGFRNIVINNDYVVLWYIQNV